MIRIIIGQGYRLRDLLIPYLLQEVKLFERSMSYEKSKRFNWSDRLTRPPRLIRLTGYLQNAED